MTRSASAESETVAWRGLRSAAWLAFCVVVAGCTSLVTPPVSVGDPTSVFLLREARHVGVVLPIERDGNVERYVEYGFGDWAWYALGEDEWYDAFPTVLWPTRGALSRREFAAHTPTELAFVAGPVELYELIVSRSRADALRERLEAEYRVRADAEVLQPAWSMTFAPCDRSYWFGVNCADVAARWLRELDCDVTRALVRIGLRARSAR